MSNFQELADNHNHSFKNNMPIEHIEGYADGTPLKARSGDMPTIDIVAEQSGFPASWVAINGSDVTFIPNGIGKTPNTTDYKAQIIFQFTFNASQETTESYYLGSFRWVLNGTPIETRGEQVWGISAHYSNEINMKCVIDIDSTLGADVLARGQIKSHTAPIEISCECYEYSSSTEFKLFRPTFWETNFGSGSTKIIKPKITIDVFGYNADDSGSTSSHIHSHDELEDDLTPKLGGNLDADGKNIINVNSITGLTTNYTTGNINNISSTLITNTTDIISNNFSVSNCLADVSPVLSSGLYNMIQNNGNVYKDVSLGHDVLNNILGFPNGQQITYLNQLPLQSNILVMKGRDGGGATIAIGSNRQVIFGNTSSFQDNMLYDPVGLRSTKIGVSWMRLKVRPHVNNCMWNFRCHYDVDFQAKNPDNRLLIKVIQYRGGLLLRTYNLLDLTTNGIQNVGSCERMINGTGFSEDILLGDEFSCHIQNDISSPTIIQVCRFVQWSIYISPLV